MDPVIVLGMHRSGTSCIAGMLAAAGIASAGQTIRNWDNARGHHEMLDLVRVNEAVLAYSGGHWLAAPAQVRWTPAHAAERDRLLRARIDGEPPLLKDPRTLLVLPFWRASTVAIRVVGVVRHPLAVARSLEAWRGVPLADGVALWLAHNRVLAAHGYPVIDFEASKPDVVAALRAAVGGDPAVLSAAYEEQLVHHDIDDPPAIAELDTAVALYHTLTSRDAPAVRESSRVRAPFPRHQLARIHPALADGDVGAALVAARDALAAVRDAAAVLIPVVTALLRARAHEQARALIAEHALGLEPGLADLLHAKVDLADGDAAGAVARLERACAVPQPMFQARQLLPQALRAARCTAEARAGIERLARDALYPHGPLSTLAEWSWLDGDRDRALDEMRTAIAAAPLYRRGRLRTRLAEWLAVLGDRSAARRELELGIEEDPGYSRSRERLTEQ